jgi:hypothetical protein
MATRTKPLVSAAVLASTAVFAVASPAVVPSLHSPSPHALEAARVQLTTFADVLELKPKDYTDAFFSGYGKVLSTRQTPTVDWATPFLAPFVGCNSNCTQSGISGVLYLVLDALISGNGTGYESKLKDPTKPEQNDASKPNFNPYVTGPASWPITAVPYFSEGGLSEGLAYLLVRPFGDPKSPLYNETTATTLVTALTGFANVTNISRTAVALVANAAKLVPGAGDYVYGALQAYLGAASTDENFAGYAGGVTGVLNYVSDVLVKGGKPIPGAAATLSAKATDAPSVDTVKTDVPKTDVPKTDAPKTDVPKTDVPKADVPKADVPKDDAATSLTTTLADVKDVSDSAPVDSNIAVSEVKSRTPAEVDTKSTGSLDSNPSPLATVGEAPSVSEAKPSTPDTEPAPSSKEVKNLEKEAAKAESSSTSSSTSSSSSSSLGGSASEIKASGSDSKTVGSDVNVSTAGATASSPAATEAKSAAADAKASASDAGTSKSTGDSAE